MLFTVLLPKPTGCAQPVVLLAQLIPVQLNTIKDTFVLLPNPHPPGQPPTKPTFIVDGVKNQSETLNVTVAVIIMWSGSERS